MSDKSLRMVRVVLHWAWDPIGVRGLPEAVEEYDMYAPSVLKLLEREAAHAEVADYLSWVEAERMELKPQRDTNRDVAALLSELHAIF